MNTKPRVLVVDDEEDLRELLSYNLKKDGYDVITANDGESCLKVLETQNVDLILLDLMMPKINGLEACKIIRSRTEIANTPIIMLTARGEESDVIVGLELGADDYIAKPFSPRVVLARIKAVLRRSQSEETNANNDELQQGPIRLDFLTREIFVNGEMIKTTFTEFEVLAFLMKNPGWVKSRTQIIRQVHGEDYPVTDRAIDVQIVGLRRKLKDAGWMIETIRGIGYRFCTKIEENQND
ncbi:MAG: response regulator transcription factor [Lentisphaeria bacterium]